jgi:hypothetical protein
MNAEQITYLLAEAIDKDKEYKSWHVSTRHLMTLVEMVVAKEREAMLQAIDALYDSQDPTPMYQDGYNHALDHIEEFVKARGKHD